MQTTMAYGSLGLVCALMPTRTEAMHPLATEDTATQGVGGVELLLFSMATQPSVSQTAYGIGNGIGLVVGLASFVDIGLSVTFEATHEEQRWTSGLADPQLTLKFRLTEAQGPFPSVGARLDYKAPQESSLSSGGHDVGGLMIASWESVRWGLQGHANLGGYARDVSTGDASWSLLASVDVLSEIYRQLLIGAEVVYETRALTQTYGVNALVGAVWEVRPAKALSFGAGPVWRSKAGPGWTVTLGFTAGLGG